MHKQLVIDGLLSSYVEMGEGRAILLLHGWGSNANVFKDLQTSLSKSFKVFAPNFPGFGGSDEPQTAWSCHEYAGWVETFMQKLHIENPIVLGHSFGGRIALILNDRLQLSRLVLTGSAGLIFKKKKTVIFKFLHRFLKKGILRKVGIRLFGSRDYRNATPQLREILKKVIADDLEGYARKVCIPTLLIWGEKDTETPVAMGRKFNELIAHSTLEILNNCGHYCFLDHKSEFFNLVNSFIR